MMTKLVAQLRGSGKDPEYASVSVQVDGTTCLFLDYLHGKGITTLEKDEIQSLHGNSVFAQQAAEQMQARADEGHQVACVAAGALSFALSGFLARHAPTVPIVSVPLDGGYEGLDAFLASHVPPGVAAFGTTGVGDYTTAVYAIDAMLNGGFGGVSTFNAPQKMLDKLKALGIPIIGEAEPGTHAGLVVGYIRRGENGLEQRVFEQFSSTGQLGLFTVEKNGNAYQAAELLWCLDGKQQEMRAQNILYVHGEENVAIYAAKILAARHPDIAEALKQMRADKEGRYKRPQIELILFTGGAP